MTRAPPHRAAGNGATAVCVIQGMDGLIEFLFEYGLDLVEYVLEHCDYAPADKEHLIRLGLSDGLLEHSPVRTLRPSIPLHSTLTTPTL